MVLLYCLLFSPTKTSLDLFLAFKAMASASSKSNPAGFSTKQVQGKSKACSQTSFVDSSETARIQEMHLLLGHTLCEYAEIKMKAML